MQIEAKSYSEPLFFGIMYSCDSQIQIDLLQFLQTQTLFIIALSAKKHKKQSQFFKLALVYACFRSFINKIDRSIYYLFYQQRQFHNLEKGFIINLSKSSYEMFYQFQKQYEQIFQTLTLSTPFIEEQQQIKQVIQSIFFQTDYPLPPFLRETIGIYTQTPFQQFLILKRFSMIEPPQEYIEPPLIKLRKYFEEKDNLGKTIELICQNGEENINKMSILRYCPYNNANIQQKQITIENFPLHNIIAVFYKFIFLNAKINRRIIQQHKDPIMKIAQYVTRANIFKNIIIAVEEKFDFLFQLYQEIFENLTKPSKEFQVPKFSFWNGAMTLWVQQFKQMESELFESYNYILLRQREFNLRKFLQEKSESFPSIYNSLKYEVQNKSLFENLKNQIYVNIGENYENFFENNNESYQILAKDFLEHQIDSSINQVNVHKIGHSQHVIKRIPLFNNFIIKIKESSNYFYQHVQKLIYKMIPDKQMRLATLKDIIKNDFSFINGKFTRPVILREIIFSAQDLIKSLIEAVPEFAVFPEQVVQKFGLNWDFSHEDNLLDYFSYQSEIPDDCPFELRDFFDTCKNLAIHQIKNLVFCMKLGSQINDSEIDSQHNNQSSFQNNSFYSSDDF